MKYSKYKIIYAVILSTLVAGCNLAPDYKTPETAVKDTFVANSDYKGTWEEGVPAASMDRGTWWTVFNDPILNGLEEKALSENLTLKAMVARVEQARQIAKFENGNLFPQVGGGVSFTRQQFSDNASGVPAGTAMGIQNTARAGINLDYELDLFGRVRNARTVAWSTFHASEEMLKSVTLSMQADVASMYFLLRSLDQDIDLLKQTIRLREDSLNILEKRVEIGTITELDTAQSIVDIETTRSALHAVEQNRKEIESSLAVLMGEAPGVFTIKPNYILAQNVPSIPAGLPSSLLQRRPDITGAQNELIAANARIGLARTAFFPRFSLTASGGFESATFGNLFELPSRTWALGPLLSLPIFSGGKAVANNKRAKAAYDESVAIYREKVLVAFKEVEDSLSRLRMLYNQSHSQDVAEKAAVKASRIAGLRYEEGEVGYLESIIARQNALSVKRFGIQIQAQRLQETVTLIRALGGEWDAKALAVEKKKIENAKPISLTTPPPAIVKTPAKEQKGAQKKDIKEDLPKPTIQNVLPPPTPPTSPPQKEKPPAKPRSLNQ